LKAVGASVWLDQLDISPGQRWDRAVEDALTNCPRMVVILSPASVNSTNVMDEVSFALEEQKTVIPVIYRDCAVPFRLRRVQHVDFRPDYARGLQVLLNILAPARSAGPSKSAILEIGSGDQSKVANTDERLRAAEQAQLEDERRKGAEQARLEEERKRAAEQARVEEERRRAAVEARLEDERRKAAERVRQEEERKQAAEQARMKEEHNHAAEGARLEDERRKAAGEGERTRQESEQAEQETQKKLPNIGWIGALPIGAGAIILIVAMAWLIFHSLNPRSGGNPNENTGTGPTEHWTARNSGTSDDIHSIFGTSDGKRLWAVGDWVPILESDDGGENWNPRAHHASGETPNELYSIFGTSDGERLWAVGSAILKSNDRGEHWNIRRFTFGNLWSIFGTSDGKRLWAVGPFMILESNDGGEHWNQSTGGTKETLASVFATSNGKRLWAVGNGGTILESNDGGEHWNARNSGTPNNLNSIFGTSDGKRLWAVGQKGTILEGTIP